MMAGRHLLPLTLGQRGPEIRWLQTLARREGVEPGPIDGIYGPRTDAAVRALAGGELPSVGRITELTLSRPLSGTPGELRCLAALIAESQIGVREMGRNRGPEIDEYVRLTGLDPTGQHAWCAAFAVWCLETVRRWTGCARTWIRSARVADHAREADARCQRVTRMDRGCLALRVGRTHGHMGIVVGPGATVEGNTDPTGSREGDGVYRRHRPMEYWTMIADWTVGGVK